MEGVGWGARVVHARVVCSKPVGWWVLGCSVGQGVEGYEWWRGVLDRKSTETY